MMRSIVLIQVSRKFTSQVLVQKNQETLRIKINCVCGMVELDGDRGA